MPNYSKQWSSATPGYLIFLIDQSSSMGHIWFKNISKAEYTADIINKTINELIASNASGETVKNRVFISLIGYGGSGPINLRSDYLNKYADKPIRIAQTNQVVSDGKGGTIEVNEAMPIFLEPAHNGWTPMGSAFDLAKKLIQGWIEKKHDHPVPVIINVSDGHPEGQNPTDTEVERRKTIIVANEIMDIATVDGPPLIFNVHISNSGKGKEIQFPQNEYELEGDPHAELLFKISSEVPEIYKRAAKTLKLKRIGEHSKGFIANASSESFVDFINFGSSGGSIQSSI